VKGLPPDESGAALFPAGYESPAAQAGDKITRFISDLSLLTD